MTSSVVVLLLAIMCFSLTSASILSFSSTFHSSVQRNPKSHTGLNFTISLLNRPWLYSAPISFHALNRTWSAADTSLIPTTYGEATGHDSIGSYTSFTFGWITNPNLTKAELQWETVFRTYDFSVDHIVAAL